MREETADFGSWNLELAYVSCQTRKKTCEAKLADAKE